MMYDVIVVGGSFAGLSAALPLARARRQVLVVDAGAPRNRYAAHAHGFLGHDGKPPAQILAEGVQQLLHYPSATLRQARAESVAIEDEGFRLTLDDGSALAARRLVLATGVRDELPPLAGLCERWGRTVVHCPYCHGYELETPLGVLAWQMAALHQAMLVSDWGPTTLFTQGLVEPDEEETTRLAARGVTIERQPVLELLGEAPGLEGVRLADGRTLPVRGLFVAPRTTMASPLAGQLGCAFEDGPLGPLLRVDATSQTSVPGVFAGGDAITAFTNVPGAAASGTMAGVAAHRSLFMSLSA